MLYFAKKLCYNKLIKSSIVLKEGKSMILQKNKKLSFSIFSILILFVSMFIFAGCGGSTPTSFSVSGVVMCGSTPVKNASVETDLGVTTTTDETGAFSISNLTTATILSFSASGYVFTESKVIVNKESSGIVVNAEQMYTLTGRVLSNNVGVAGAKIIVSGLVNLTVTSDSNGYFTAPNIAGESHVSVEKDGMVFETKTATIDTNYIEFSGTTSITATVSGSDGAVLEVNGAPMSFENGKYSASNIALGSIVTPKLDGYHFEPTQMTVSRENQNLEFTAYQLYSITGTAKSGEVGISGVNILVNGKVAGTSNANGEFVLNDLWGENNITYSHSIFKFTGEKVDGATALTAVGTFNFSGKIVSNGVALENVFVTYNNDIILTNTLGEFTLNGVMLGDEITFSKDGFREITHTINATNSIILEMVEYYDATITITSDGEVLEGAKITLDGVEYESNDRGQIVLNNLIKDYSATLTCDGYTSAEITISKQNSTINVALSKIFDVNITVHSGSTVLANASITYNGTSATTNELGEFSILNLTKPTEITVSFENYNSKTLTASKNNTTLDFDLDYTISGYVYNGALGVNGEIKAESGASAQIVDGVYSITLKGADKIIPVVSGLNFTESETKGNDTVDFYASYSISGTLISEDVPVSNAIVTLFGGAEPQEYTTKADGKYEFSGLAGVYTLLISDSQDTTLNPQYYLITCGGEYDFNANGYAVSGRVESGGIGVSGVTVFAGDNSTTTDVSGNFTFDLLIGETVISAFKEGYTFDDDIEVSDDTIGLVINATYEVSGTVLSGTTPISDVLVTIGDKSTTTNSEGKFTLLGLIGNNELVLSKTGYSFTNININGYFNEIIYTTFSISGSASVGERVMSGATISNGKNSTTTNELGEFTLSGVSIGETITATLDGYTFNTITVTEYGQEFVFSGTYEISGTVTSGGRVVANVLVQLGEFSTTTDALGRFTLKNVNVFGEMTFTLAGYNFSPVNVDEPKGSLDIMATFAVNGKITIGGVGLSGVTISSNGISTTTNTNGEYTLSGLSTSGLLTVEKYGYDFEGTKIFTGASTLDFTATYWVTVVVSSGSVQLNGIILTLENGRYEEMGNGVFTVRGLVGENKIFADVNGYNTGEVVVTDHAENVAINMTYDVVLKINGAKLNNINISYSDEKGSYTDTFSDIQYILRTLTGTGRFEISLDGYRFTPNTDSYSIPKTVEISYQAVYTVSGRVTTNNGVGVSNMEISFKDVSTTTDTDGNYTLTGLIGDGTLYATLSATNCDTVLKSAYVSTSTTVNFTVSDSEYAWWLFQSGYQKLRDSETGYFSETKGSVRSVVDLGLTQINVNQTVYSTKQMERKDGQTRYLTLNSNYGTTFKDTRVAVVGYYDGNSLQYKHITGDSVNKPDGNGVVTGNFSGSWNTNLDLTGFKGTYGSEPTGLYIYNLTSAYFNTTVSRSGDSLTFTVTVDNPSDSFVANYKIQMASLSGVDPSDVTFKSIALTYTYDLNGNLKSVYSNESYDVYYGVNANTTSTLTETFTTDASKSAIDLSKYE